MKNTEQPASGPQANKGKRDGVMSKLSSAARVWLDLFMGRPRYKKPAIQGTAEIKSKNVSVVFMVRDRWIT